MAVKKISRWELESASGVSRGDQRDSWTEHAKMTLATAPLHRGKQVVSITATAGVNTWYLDELIDTLKELRDESTKPPRYQTKD